MRVHLLETTIYQESGWGWHTEKIPEPTWDNIQAAIRRLDRFLYPFVRLHLSADAAGDGVPDFEIIGGSGEYAMNLNPYNDDGRHCLRYYNAHRGDTPIEVWKSDQGATFEAKYCCRSLDTVLHATRYFCEHGASMAHWLQIWSGSHRRD